MTDSSPIVRRGSRMAAEPTRRAGLRERRLLTPADSALQNVIQIDADEGAAVEMHPVANSETLYVLEGEIEVTAPGFAERLGPGDLVHFQPGASHGMKVVRGPAQYVVVFAPARA